MFIYLQVCDVILSTERGLLDHQHINEKSGKNLATVDFNQGTRVFHYLHTKVTSRLVCNDCNTKYVRGLVLESSITNHRMSPHHFSPLYPVMQTGLNYKVAPYWLLYSTF